MIFIYDILCHILYIFSTYILVDDGGVIIISILFIYCFCKHESGFTPKMRLIFFAAFIIGFGFRIFGVVQYDNGKSEEEEKDPFVTIHFILILIRFFDLGCCLQVFNDYSG